MAHVLDTPGTVTLGGRALVVAERPAHQAYSILRVGFALLPIVAGLDKFMHLLVEWNHYLAPAVAQALPVDAGTFLMIVGVIEIAAGILVAVAPRIGGYVVAAWLWGIIVNLLMMGNYYDIALRDFGLSLGAIALARLATHFEGTRRIDV
ncbi:MAG TPA: hypothetical protein VHR17_14040 [Thermoanaerobaculia bacterium]|jgi:uncharacterized membrane protein YphA (DoxX/SURF4 family)|nr:hypothetical protein [Thermoanaerobaculia bacterium]